MSNAIVCPLEFIVSVYSQLLLLAWESMVMWSSTRYGKDHPSFCSHCRIKQKTKENRISSTLEETPWQDWVHGSGKLAMSAQTNCNNHHWQLTCALTTSALKNYIMWWRETVMLVVAMIDSSLCSLCRDVLLENSSCLFPKTFHCSKVFIIYYSPHTYMLSGDGLDTYTGSITTNWFIVKVDMWILKGHLSPNHGILKLFLVVGYCQSLLCVIAHRGGCMAARLLVM